MASKKKFTITVLVVQISFILLYAFLMDYGQQLDANQDKYLLQGRDPGPTKFHAMYPMFQDVNAMIFIGVGFLYTYMRKYSYMGVGMNMLLAAISIQWSIFTYNWWSSEDGKIRIDIDSLISAEFAAASVVISLGAVFGKMNPFQMVVFALIETFFYTTNEYFSLKLLQVSDIAGSVSLHLFAGTFGLAAAFAADKTLDVQDNINDEPSYESNLFCMIGTVLLWCFWPSFNASLAIEDAMHRAVLNTFLALLGSCVAAFAVSSLMNKNSKFLMSHIQNATLAGGVAVGATCDLMIQPYGALLIGCLGGTLSVLGFCYFGPFLAKLTIYDPCGVNSLHVIPGFFAGITSIAAAFIATEMNYGYSLYRFYPAMAPLQNSSALANIQIAHPDIMAGADRSPTFQACYQIAYVVEIVIIAIITGLLTGAFLRIKFFNRLEKKHLYLDEVFWNVPDSSHKITNTNTESNDSKL